MIEINNEMKKAIINTINSNVEKTLNDNTINKNESNTINLNFKKYIIILILIMV